MELMTRTLTARFPALAPIYAVQSDLYNCDQADRDLDHRLVLAFLPGLAPAAPHCVGEEPIFFHDPLHKRPVPRLTAVVDDVLDLMVTMRIPRNERFALVAESAHCLLAKGTSPNVNAAEALARSLSICLLEHRIRQHHSDPEAYAKIDFS